MEGRELVRQGLLGVLGIRGWGHSVEAHQDHAWILMCIHTQRETRMHYGELGVEVVQGKDEDDARSAVFQASRGSRQSKGRLGWPRKVQSPPPPPAVSAPNAPPPPPGA